MSDCGLGVEGSNFSLKSIDNPRSSSISASSREVNEKDENGISAYRSDAVVLLADIDKMKALVKRGKALAVRRNATEHLKYLVQYPKNVSRVKNTWKTLKKLVGRNVSQ